MTSTGRIAGMLAGLAIMFTLLYSSFEVVGPSLGQATHPLVGLGLAYALFMVVWTTTINSLTGEPLPNDLVRNLVLPLSGFVPIAAFLFFIEPALSTALAKLWGLACAVVVGSTLFGVAWNVKLPLSKTKTSALVRSGLVGLIAGLAYSFFWVLK